MNLDFDLLFSNSLFISKKLLREKFRKFADYLNGYVLDVGCGKKPYKNFLKYEKYIGIDTNKKIKPDILCEVTDIPFMDESFDSICCTEVLEHHLEPSIGLKEIRRVLKKKGILYVTVPMSWCLHYEPNDYYWFTRYGLKYLLEKTGFEVVNMEKIGGLFSLLGVRFVDGFWIKFMFKIFFFLPWSVRSRIAELSSIPLNLLFYYCSKYLDRFQKIDAIGWMALARKK